MFTDKIRPAAAARWIAVTGIAAGTVIFGASASAQADATWSYVNAANQKCLDVEGHGTLPWVQVYNCHWGPNQEWVEVVQSDSTIVLFTNGTSSDKCLSGGGGRGQRVVVSECYQSDQSIYWYNYRHWVDRREYWRFENKKYPGQCLDVEGFGTSHRVITWDCHGGWNQLWYR
jgi:hypothetical protein